MKIPFNLDGQGLVDLEIREHDFGDPKMLTMLVPNPAGAPVVLPLPRNWFDHSFLKDIGLT